MYRVVHNVPVMDEFVIKTKRKPTGAAAMGPGPGRPKGCPNKTPTQLREMILRALDGAVDLTNELAQAVARGG